MSEATGEMRALVAQRQMDVEDAIFGVGSIQGYPRVPAPCSRPNSV